MVRIRPPPPYFLSLATVSLVTNNADALFFAIRCILRGHRIMAITSAFQADDAGSIPAARSKFYLKMELPMFSMYLKTQKILPAACLLNTMFVNIMMFLQ